MTETSKFQPVGTKGIYEDGIGQVTLYDASHANESEEQRIWTVTTIASLAYGNEEAKNPEALYQRMRSIKHESLWEFIRGSNMFTTKNSMRGNMRLSTFKTDATYFKHDISKYLLRHKANIACFRIKVPMFVRAQFMRHRSFSYLEMSRRYTKGAKVPFEFWYPADFEISNDFLKSEWSHGIASNYHHLINSGYETQVASRFLPQTTYTEFYMMGEVEGLKNFFRLRLDEHAQTEIRVVAEAMIVLLEEHQPELVNHIKGVE